MSIYNVCVCMNISIGVYVCVFIFLCIFLCLCMLMHIHIYVRACSVRVGSANPAGRMGMLCEGSRETRLPPCRSQVMGDVPSILLTVNITVKFTQVGCKNDGRFVVLTLISRN